MKNLLVLMAYALEYENGAIWEWERFDALPENASDLDKAKHAEVEAEKIVRKHWGDGLYEECADGDFDTSWDEATFKKALIKYTRFFDVPEGVIKHDEDGLMIGK